MTGIVATIAVVAIVAAWNNLKPYLYAALALTLAATLTYNLIGA